MTTTTNTDQQVAQSETLEQISERIVLDACNNRSVKQVNAFVKEDYQRLADTIEAALQDRDERAAKIAEKHEGHGVWCSSAAGDCQSLTVKAIARAIREGR